MSDHLDQNLAGGYVLDALEPEEYEAFERHLESCNTCRAEVAELRRVVDVLPLAVEPVEPPSSLRARILAEVQDRPAGLSVLPDGKQESATTTRQSRSWFRDHAGALSIAAALLIASLAGWNAYLQTHNGSSSDRYTALVAQARQSGALLYPVAGTTLEPAASAVLVQPRGSKPAYAIVRGLSAPPPNKVYELWFMRGSRPTSEAVFTPAGTTGEIIRLATPTTGYNVTAVTIEPAPHGSSGPTTPAVLAGRLGA